MEKQLTPSVDARYVFVVNLDERGEFYADVRDPSGETVFEIRNDSETGEIEMVTDGFMRHARDVDGLENYLKEHSIIPNWAFLEKEGA